MRLPLAGRADPHKHTPPVARAVTGTPGLTASHWRRRSCSMREVEEGSEGSTDAPSDREDAHQEEPLGARRVRVVLQGGGPEVGVHHMAGLLVQGRDPGGELAGVGEGRRQEHHAGLARQEDDRLLPHDAALAVLLWGGTCSRPSLATVHSPPIVAPPFGRARVGLCQSPAPSSQMQRRHMQGLRTMLTCDGGAFPS